MNAIGRNISCDRFRLMIVCEDPLAQTRDRIIPKISIRSKDLHVCWPVARIASP